MQSLLFLNFSIKSVSCQQYIACLRRLHWASRNDKNFFRLPLFDLCLSNCNVQFHHVLKIEENICIALFYAASVSRCLKLDGFSHYFLLLISFSLVYFPRDMRETIKARILHKKFRIRLIRKYALNWISESIWVKLDDKAFFMCKLTTSVTTFSRKLPTNKYPKWLKKKLNKSRINQNSLINNQKQYRLVDALKYSLLKTYRKQALCKFPVHNTIIFSKNFLVF